MSLKEYMTITKAAEFLGIVPNTLRNWERVGKITVHRNPMNKYRMYKKVDIEKIYNEMYGQPSVDKMETDESKGNE